MAQGAPVFSTTFLRPHTAQLRCARSVCRLQCYFLVIQQKSNQESELGRSLRGLPPIAALQGEQRRKTYLSSCNSCRLATTSGRQRKQKRFCMNSKQTVVRQKNASIFIVPPACVLRVCKFLSLANAKAEFA